MRFVSDDGCSTTVGFGEELVSPLMPWLTYLLTYLLNVAERMSSRATILSVLSELSWSPNRYEVLERRSPLHSNGTDRERVVTWRIAMNIVQSSSSRFFFFFFFFFFFLYYVFSRLRLDLQLQCNWFFDCHLSPDYLVLITPKKNRPHSASNLYLGPILEQKPTGLKLPYGGWGGLQTIFWYRV